jgi:5-methyltetrahydrofolate--homocysteine methyltransferase
VHTAVKIHPNYRRGQTVYVTDASRAVGVPQPDVAQARAPTSPTSRANTPDRRRACARRGDKQRLSLADARANALKLDWSGTTAAAAALPRHAGARRLSDRRAGRLHRLDAVLRDLGADRQIPGDPRRRQIRRGGAQRSTTTRRRCSNDRREAGSRRGGVGFWPANATATTSWCSATSAHEPIAVLHTLRQQLTAREGRANVALADFVAPRASGLPTISALHGDGRHRRGRRRERFKRATTIIRRSWSRRWPIGWPKRSPSAAPARAQEFWGYAPDEALHQPS